MFHRYRHESDIYPSLSRIPLDVRMKLDMTGIKISLKDWLSFSLEERTVLCHLPVESDEERECFFSYLDFLARRYCDAAVATTAALSSSLWGNSDGVPEPVSGKYRPEIAPVSADEWRQWNFCQRYALYKTALSQSEPEHFFALLKELRELKA
jgi:hypothetical protein